MIEQERRREAFSQGEGVELADGQTWFFPSAIVEMRPRFENGRPSFANPIRRLSFGPEHDAGLAEIRASGTEAQRFDGVVYLAADLLRSNYDLTDDQLSDLLSVTVDETGGFTDSTSRRWSSIIEAVSLPEIAEPPPIEKCPTCGHVRTKETEGLS
jgi:hypothetical protein